MAVPLLAAGLRVAATGGRLLASGARVAGQTGRAVRASSSMVKATSSLVKSKPSRGKRIKAEKYSKGGRDSGRGSALVKSSESELAVRPSSALVPKMKMRKMVSSADLKQTSRNAEGKNVFDTLRQILDSLIKTTDALSQVMKNQLTNTLRKNDQSRKSLQRAKKNRKQEEAEVKEERVKKDFGLPKPKVPFGQQIMNFIKGFVFGTAVMELIKWLSDPDKKKSLFKFLEDNLGKIFLAALGVTALMVASPLLSAVSMMLTGLSILGGIIGILFPFALPTLIPAAAAAALFTAPAWLPKVMPGLVDQQERKVDQAPGTDQQKIKQLKEQYDNLGWFEKYVWGVGFEIQEQIKRLEQRIQQGGGQSASSSGPSSSVPLGASANIDPKIIKASHPDTGSGFGIQGLKDRYGRPAVFSQFAASAFARMMVDSGGIVKGSDIASSGRSKIKNASLKGADPNSHHLYGEAVDIHGDSKQWMIENASKYGWEWSGDYGGSHDGHFKYVGQGAGVP
ncbi:MAG: hypothetical protein ACXADH_16980, partial [Candidatus Kariarchaeaceae archaeon]